MIKGIFPEEKAIAIAQEALGRYLHIHKIPEKCIVSEAREALYQYPVGHQEKVAALEASLPKSILGARFYGVGINDCIDHAYKLAKVISDS
jgi:protoporphyrinogen oxidase